MERYFFSSKETACSRAGQPFPFRRFQNNNSCSAIADRFENAITFLLADEATAKLIFSISSQETAGCLDKILDPFTF